MKKIIGMCLAAICLVGCSSAQYHNGRNSVLLSNIDAVDVRPMQADLKVEKQISGSAECETWFGFLTKKPERQSYGIQLQQSAGNFSPSACTRGAVYEALSKNNADVIVAPRYTAVQKGEFCIFGWCAHRVNQIIVSGYKGTIADIRPLDDEIIKVKQKSAYSKDTQAIVSIQ